MASQSRIHRSRQTIEHREVCGQVHSRNLLRFRLHHKDWAATSAAQWNGSAWTQKDYIEFAGLVFGTTYYLRAAVIAPLSGVLSAWTTTIRRLALHLLPAARIQERTQQPRQASVT
jgi:hypothetical protein